ncbi:unnamed protein product [Musa textilis]
MVHRMPWRSPKWEEHRGLKAPKRSGTNGSIHRQIHHASLLQQMNVAWATRSHVPGVLVFGLRTSRERLRQVLLLRLGIGKVSWVRKPRDTRAPEPELLLSLPPGKTARNAELRGCHPRRI